VSYCSWCVFRVVASPFLPQVDKPLATRIEWVPNSEVLPVVLVDLTHLPASR
jgi:hypothetical protein